VKVEIQIAKTPHHKTGRTWKAQILFNARRFL
jgi:hypothetical protein